MSESPFRIAVVGTIYFANSHCDVIATRWLEPREDDTAWGWPKPRSSIVSMSLEQIGDNDVGCEIFARNGVEIYDSVAGALGCGSDGLNVDGILLIGEHGDYPDNELGQKLYPRKELFDRIVRVFRESGRSVPGFCDKHLSWSTDLAREMQQTADEMGFMLFSSSSIPLCRRVPPVDLAGRDRVEEAVTLFYGPDECYGYHSFEFAQAIVERRAGGETGVEAITVHRGDDVWREVDAERISPELTDAALAAIVRASPGCVKEGDVRENSKGDGEVSAFCIEHRDGMRMTHINLSGHLSTWSLAMRIAGRDAPVVTVPVVDDATHFHAHFGTMSRIVEDAMIDNRPPFAPGRSLMTAGLTDFMMRARAQPGTRLATPALEFSYDPFGYEHTFAM